jgi:hypothetical protein
MKTLLFAALLAAATWSAPFNPGKADFAVEYLEETSPYRINGFFAMPGERVDFRVKHPGGSRFAWIDADGDTLGEGSAWSWNAPAEPGLYPFLAVRDGKDTMGFNGFVMVPASSMEGEYLEGYRIGRYPSRPLKGLRFYRNPEGFVRLDSASAEALVSPHFRIGQFLCKQQRGFPAFLVLRERLVLKLEGILEEVNRHGHRAETFHVMSGFRTPFYNRRIGNVKHSAHQWGGAADVFIDHDPVDGSMDDLNGDGKSDRKDSGILFDIVDRMSLDRYYLPYLGGIGSYSRNESHGPFVHVDVRGFRAIWRGR